MAQSPCFLLPMLIPFLLPFIYLETLLGVIGSRPPWSQVTFELTSPFSTPPHPLPIPNSWHPFSGFPSIPRQQRRRLDSGFQGPEQVELCECSEIAGSPQGSPQQPTMLVVKLEGGPAASRKPGQKSCVRSSGIITVSARRPSDGLGRSLPQTRSQKSIMSGSPM
jgi:hypothetical protein